jgi:hypothetical protein
MDITKGLFRLHQQPGWLGGAQGSSNLQKLRSGIINPTGTFRCFLEVAATLDKGTGKDQELPTTLYKDMHAQCIIRFTELKALRGKPVTPG